MARKCPDCGHMNSDEMAFCAECGEPIDPKVRLVMELEGKKSPTAHSGVRKIADASDESDTRSRSSRNDDDNDYIPSLHAEEEKKKLPFGLVIGLAIAAAAVWFLFF